MPKEVKNSKQFEGVFKVQFRKIITVTGRLGWDGDTGMFTLRTDGGISLINPKAILFIEGRRNSVMTEEYQSPIA